jgi:prophage regulatory protein
MTCAASSTDNDSVQLLAKPDVLRITTFSDTTLWRRVTDGTFPAPIRISKGRVAWRLMDIKAWQASR